MTSFLFVIVTGGIIGPVLGGYIFDRSGSYLIAFLIAALAFLTSAVLTLFACPPAEPRNVNKVIKN